MNEENQLFVTYESVEFEQYPSEFIKYVSNQVIRKNQKITICIWPLDTNNFG